jgi:hypothetical protein
MKKIIYTSLCIAFCWGCKSPESGTIDSLTWSLSGGALTISGTGEIPDYNHNANYPVVPPWYDYSDSITQVNITDGVTSIGIDAFNFCDSITSITIPGSVTTVGENVFKGCTKLENVAVLSTSPPEIYSNTFEKANSATLTVPKGCKAAYQKAKGWKKFGTIIEQTTTITPPPGNVP